MHVFVIYFIYSFFTVKGVYADIILIYLLYARV